MQHYFESIRFEMRFLCPRLEFSTATKKADNFMGQLFRCNLTDDNSKKELRLIVKLPHADEHRRKLVRIEKYFRKEAFMYGTVLPTLANCYIQRNLLPKDAVFPCTAR